ncbi:MAG: OsmC family peroxiredoxin [Nitrospinaceae bacterium]|nr:OsmC family peroxiredoxin [Nitrospinaceae bacterium]NIR55102.1 OsmC family peroxiredoxin [Nitrospinaceae bacterium]NIS85511.1 OsmC family peroxiredoxin [Nitrospinaceae bacterium]NIT82351.1 OsmC family peroxiredoxin [Nitrospinaceae bacterium]NIU44567.1 OsmC family peroxiredoxin [Nitrospinaceae bacterium]
MSEHRVNVQWTRNGNTFNHETYNRDHAWTFDNGIEIKASAAPGFQGNPDCVDPEEALVGALSSCHMLTFLAIAAKKRLVVDRYEDHAVGYLEENADGRMAVTRATLRPKVAWGGDKTPTPEEIEKMHEKAHRACFIANSVRTEVSIESP